MKIFVMERGFVLVGKPIEDDDWLFLTLKNCAVVRRWGTANGLGELATNGPTESTILDKEPDGTRIRKTAIYREIPCNAEVWK